MFRKLKESIDRRVANFSNQHVAFGIFGILNYPIYYIIWNIYEKNSYENFWLRAIATLLCVFIVLKNKWPAKLRTWFPLCWYVTLLFCLPFFFTFMLFENNLSSVWLMSNTVMIFWLLLLVDWASYIILLTLGLLLAVLSYILFTDAPFAAVPDYAGILAQYFGSIAVVSFFAHKKEWFERTKIETIKAVAASIAHEIRTPLAAITMAGEGIRKYWSHLISGYSLAKEHHLPVKPLRNSQLSNITTSVEDILEESNYANTIINMLLVKSNESALDSSELSLCSMQACVDESLRRYPFAPGERDLVHWDNKLDFTFKGNQLFMTHVLFNLLKNAIYYVRAAGKGNIHIWLEESKTVNKLYFKDTGDRKSVV